MRKLIIFLSILSSLASFGQGGLTRYYTSPREKAVFLGTVEVDSGLYNAKGDTTFTPSRTGFQLFKTSDSTIYSYRSIVGPQHWWAVGTGVGGSGDTTSTYSTKYYAKHYADSLKAIIQNIYAGYGLKAFNDSTLQADSLVLASWTHLYKVIDSLKTLVGGTFGDALLAGNQTFTGINDFSNSQFKLSGNPYDGSIATKTVLMYDSISKKLSHQVPIYVDLTSIAAGDHLKWDAVNGKLIRDNAIYFSSASNGNIPYGTGVSWTTGNLNWSGRLLHLNGAQAGIELSSTRSSSPNYMILAANSTYTYPFNIIDTIHGVTSTLRFAIGGNGEVVLPGGQVIKKANVGNINYNIQPTDYLINFVTLTAARNVNASATPPLDGQVFIVKDETGTAGTNNITFVGTLDGVTNPVIINTNYGSKRIYYSSSAAAYFSLN